MRRDRKRTASIHLKQKQPPASSGRLQCAQMLRGASALRRRRWRRRRWRRRRRPRAALCHELIELGLVASETQPVEKFPELALLLFETTQRLSPVFVEGVVAARWLLLPPLPSLP